MKSFRLSRVQSPYFKSYFGIRFEKLVAMHASARHLGLLDKLQDFMFTPYPKYRPSQSLVGAFSQVIYQRAKDAKQVVHKTLRDQKARLAWR